MTTRKYAAMTGASRATAFRELDQLHEAGMLLRSGQGRSVRYALMRCNLDRMRESRYVCDDDFDGGR